ncbi:MAG: hypothetical protein ACLFVJ_16365 [Persicimonas sp.]
MTARGRIISVLLLFSAVGLLVTLPGSSGHSQQSDPDIRVTVVLHQEQNMTVEEIRATFEQNGFHEAFPPEDAVVESWQGVLDLGHVITLRLPAHRVPEVERAIDEREWGKIKPEVHASYDYRPLWLDGGGELDPGAPSRAGRTRSTHSTRMLIAP